MVESIDESDCFKGLEDKKLTKHEFIVLTNCL